MNNRPSVYAGGPINGLDFVAATQRRKWLAAELDKLGIDLLSPMRWKQMLADTGKLTSGGIYEEHPLTARAGIVARDRFDVMRCDLMLADFEYPAVRHGKFYSEFTRKYYQASLELASIGTSVEFGWADAYRKPIVTILKPGGVHDHPFIRQLSGFIVPSLEEAVEIIRCVLLQEPVE